MKVTRFRDIPQLTRDGNWQADYTLKSALETIDYWVKELNLDINPDFQRLHVWTETQQVEWMEFMLRGGKTGRVIYLNNPNWYPRLI